MANEVAKTSATANFFEKYGQAATAGSFLGQLLTLNKFDEFTYGRDKAKLAHGTVMLGVRGIRAPAPRRPQLRRPRELAEKR
jgi:hypothetical protein